MAPARLRRRTRRAWAVGAVLVLAGAGLGACSHSEPEPTAVEGSSSCADVADHGTGLSGRTVTIATSFSGIEAERFDESVADFERCTGIDIVQEGSDSLESDLRAQAEAAASASASAAGTEAEAAAGEESPDQNPGSSGEAASELPDLAIVPQPGLIDDLASSDLIVPLPEEVNANIELGWDSTWSEAGAVGGTPYGAPLMASVKSLIWYSPSVFEAAGYAVPRTWEELTALTDRIAADHPGGDVTPWCLGVSDGESTGWTVSDWLEEALLANGGTSAYDAWSDHSAPLDSSDAVTALDDVGSLLLSDGHVRGGRSGALSTTVEAAGQQFTSGQCLMLHASSSYETMLPAGTVVTDADGENPVTVTDATSAATSASAGATAADPIASDATAADPTASDATPSASSSATDGGADPSVLSAFVVPGADADQDQAGPVIVGGDFLVATTEDPAATAVMEYLTGARWAQERISLGGMATANRAVDASQVSSDVTRRATELLQDRQTVVRLDASDTMPSEVGTDVLWEALTRWVAGDIGSQVALAQAEAAWPTTP